MTTLLLPTYALWIRDLQHFVRQRSRVIGAVGQPFVIWIFLAAGFRNSMHAGGVEYGSWLFPGVILLIALFAAIFSTISVIDDRDSGFLQGVMTSPAPRGAIVLSKMLAGTTIAVLQSVIFMILLPFSGISLSLNAIVLSLIILVVAGMMLTALGFIIAWRMQSTQGFHAVMNLLLLPLWMLSGAFFPLASASGWMRIVMQLNPLYYVTTLFQESFFLGSDISVSSAPAVGLSIAVTAALLFLLTMISFRMVQQR
ncbi:ABC transporter permease [bacterium]|nr:ABC transporter permease [bacterium]